MWGWGHIAPPFHLKFVADPDMGGWEWNGKGVWTLGIFARRWNSQVSPTAPWSGATLNPEHQDQRSIMVFREVYFPFKNIFIKEIGFSPIYINFCLLNVTF